MTGDELRELQDRGRFFYQSFPGAAAAEEWKRAREAAERKYVDASDYILTPSDLGTNGETTSLGIESATPMPSQNPQA